MATGRILFRFLGRKGRAAPAIKQFADNIHGQHDDDNSCPSQHIAQVMVQGSGQRLNDRRPIGDRNDRPDR